MTPGGAAIAFSADRTAEARGRCSHSTSTLQPLPPPTSKLDSATPSGSRAASTATASPGVRTAGSRTRIAHRPRADFGIVFTEGRSARLFGGHDEARHHLLGACLVEIDVELVALDRDDLAIAELLMEHARTDRVGGAARGRADGHVDDRTRPFHPGTT